MYTIKSILTSLRARLLSTMIPMFVSDGLVMTLHLKVNFDLLQTSSFAHARGADVAGVCQLDTANHDRGADYTAWMVSHGLCCTDSLITQSISRLI